LYSNGKYYSNAGPIVDVQDILFTKNHDLYIGGYNLGLNAQFEKMGRKRTLPIGQKPLDKILNIAPINKDEILLGTDDKGLLKFNVVTGEVNNIVIKDLPNKDIDVVKSIYRDKTGQFWLGHWHKGMTSFNLNGNRLQNYRNNGPAPFYLPESNNHVWGFTEDQDSNFWILMLRSSAVCYNKDRSQKIVFNKQYGLPDLGDSQLLDIHTDADGNVWLASENKGLYVRWRGKESFQRIQHQDGDVHSLATNSCLMVFSDSKNNIWVGTKDKGLDLLDKVNNRFIHFSTAEGLLENMVVSMVENTNGDIWIATPSGISRIRLFDGRYKVDFKYPISKTYNFAHLASYLDAETATLYLGGSEGLYALDLKEFDVPRESPRVLISGLNFQKDSSVPPASDSLLHHLNKFGWLTFQKRNAFVSLNLASTILNESKSNEFAYKLDGFESTWHFLKDGERQVTYIGLPEGHYKLHLKTKTPYSDWGETRIVGIRVVAPFWDTQWFFRLILIACSTLIAGVFVLYWLRRQELLTRMRLEIENQKLEKNREQLSYEVLDQSSELIVRTVEIMHQKTVMEEVQQKLGTLQNAGANKDTEVMAQLSKMLQSESSNDDWEAFRIYVDQRNAQFSQKLTTQYPSLTPTDVRHCILIRLNMSTHDIAKLLKISVQGVQKSRFRLKKKLGLNQSIDLYAFIASI
jgi:DNA-binding transcriptional regulator YiaG